MKAKFRTAAFAALLALALAPTSRALAADSTDEAKATKAKIDSLRTESGKIRSQIGLTLEELNRLHKDSVDLREQFQKYSVEVSKMQDQAKVARDRAAVMGEKGKAFFQSWEDQINSIRNEDIRKQAQKRYEKRVNSYNKIVKAMIEARDELVPFLSDLSDIKKLLDSELTRGSVKSAKNLTKEANAHGEDVVDSLKDVETELDRVSAELDKYE
jgi:hypothetical protein